MGRTQLEKPLRQRLWEAVDEGLLILGEGGRQAARWHLLMEIAVDSPETLAKGLHQLFWARRHL